ncbi:hypothetical protein Atai01_00420 [Amycolatopsis taiwanensis]|uniref:TNT domain-containing protein n=1 Tax=Amycolatopsis taiwanensis TaxID=342230 RepID=A0A9W6QTG7_9PSEU|nr:glycohydrolase toxin TNT-related protein [Amycolatopsis taiwanensis]GLY63423.1 hypothetical protein Atai01_00420 [Amycolatopsis taiwanensis]
MVTPTTQLNATEQDTLVKQIGLALLRAAPRDWRRVTAEYRAVGRYHELTGEVLVEDGSVKEWMATHDIATLFSRLRGGMYRDGRGTWFNARYQLDHPSSYNLEYDRDEPQWNLAPPAQAYIDELRMFPRSEENVPEWLVRRLSGLSPEQSGPRFRIARIFDGQDGAGRPILNRPELDSDELDRLRTYLDSAPVVLSERGYDLDRLAAAPVPKVPVAFHTDGVWIWPAAVNYYLQEHRVAPESELVAHIRSTGFSLPEVPDQTLQAAAAHLGRPAPPPPPSPAAPPSPSAPPPAPPRPPAPLAEETTTISPTISAAEPEPEPEPEPRYEESVFDSPAHEEPEEPAAPVEQPTMFTPMVPVEPPEYEPAEPENTAAPDGGPGSSHLAPPALENRRSLESPLPDNRPNLEPPALDTRPSLEPPALENRRGLEPPLPENRRSLEQPLPDSRPSLEPPALDTRPGPASQAHDNRPGPAPMIRESGPGPSPMAPPAPKPPAPPAAEPAFETLRRKLDELGVSADAYRIGEPAERGWSVEKVASGWRAGWYDQGLASSAMFGDAADAAAFMLGKLLLDPGARAAAPGAHSDSPTARAASISDFDDVTPAAGRATSISDFDDATPITGLRSDRPREEPPAPEPPAPPMPAPERFEEPDPAGAEPTMLAQPVPPPPPPAPVTPPPPPPAPRRDALPRRGEPQRPAAAAGSGGSGQQWNIQPLPGEPPLTLFRGKEMRELPPGSELDRFGPPNGNLTYAAGTPFEERSLVPEWVNRPYHVYRVQRPLEVLAGVAIPWFNQPGGGAAYLLPASIDELVAEGDLVELDPGEPPID